MLPINSYCITILSPHTTERYVAAKCTVVQPVMGWSSDLIITYGSFVPIKFTKFFLLLTNIWVVRRDKDEKL